MLISYLLASSENQTLYPLDFLVRMDSLFVLCKDADATCHAVHLLQGNYKTGHSCGGKARAPIVLLKCTAFIHLLSESGNNRAVTMQ